jgi:glyoxylase-like metal-dependent hydrolase (beta-lactamase superfamily II)
MDQERQQREHDTFIPMTSISSGMGREVKKDVYYYTDQIANIICIGEPRGKWVLVDAGLPNAADDIKNMVEDRFGEGARPEAIILTHGHFDHVGGLADLIDEWDVTVYAHELELPYLQGEKDYPEPDMSVEGGMLAKISGLYPNESINLGDRVKVLPDDHSVPELDGWEWIHTPGHSPGHVSFYRKSDSLLISGDAFITVRQDSFYNVLAQTEEVNGPPRYLTTDWKQAYESVKRLEALRPQIVVPGHGETMEGKDLTEGLRRLVDNFQSLAVPDHGRYVDGENLQ